MKDNLESRIERIREEVGEKVYGLLVDKSYEKIAFAERSDLGATELRQRALIQVYLEYKNGGNYNERPAN